MEKRIADLERRIAELEGKPAKPAGNRARFDPTEGMSMPGSAVAAMADVDVRGIVDDFRRGVPQPSGLIGASPEPPPVRGSGWQEPKPLSVPPGIDLIDAMCGAKK
jgi:hypothetical protein